MVVTVAVVVVATGDLSKGVFAGVILSAVFIVSKISKVKVEMEGKGDKLVYHVSGQVFFASVEDMTSAFDVPDGIKEIEIDFSRAHIWNESGVAAIDRIILKLKGNGITVRLKGLNQPSSKLFNRLAVHGKAEI